MIRENPIQIVVWSDYVCPFCYLERPVLERIQKELGDNVQIDWRSFELRPEPEPTLDPNAEYLHRVWNQSVYPMAQDRGLTLKLPPVQPRSRKAHEAAEFARDGGRIDAMNKALFKAFFEQGRDLADIEILLDIGRSVGLDPEDLREALVSGRYTQRVLDDEHLARQIGISGVPALVISAGHQAYLVSGAQPYETVKDVIASATGEKKPAT
ncbi:disulfide bond formation protein DsbA [Microvirga sp. KLBC 81]|uniref:DsbA family oxidoreductase n=1 Tax=Microvirga sp. KLBC 81 TaxID=1862707 RepID=UPI000D5209E7|nr:DsbA family oxidoreductase [Microvirga sp. KLBC 81]PVE25088.1 disulfide bond formation protein DsbA [Microvirga sp. KLBC 81]